MRATRPNLKNDLGSLLTGTVPVNRVRRKCFCANLKLRMAGTRPAKIMAEMAPKSLKPSKKKMRASRVLVRGAARLIKLNSLNLSLAWSRDK